MTSAGKRRRARRLLKAHTKGISDRHNRGMAYLAKLERRRVGLRKDKTAPRPPDPRVTLTGTPTPDARPTLADQLQSARDQGLIP